MTDANPLAPIEALLEPPNHIHLGDDHPFVSVGMLAAALAEARQAVDALDHPHDDQCESEYETGAHAWTPCGCWASRSEAEGLLHRAEAAEAERDAAREALARVEAVCDKAEAWYAPTRPAGWIGEVRAALTQPATDKEAGQ